MVAVYSQWQFMAGPDCLEAYLQDLPSVPHRVPWRPTLHLRASVEELWPPERVSEVAVPWRRVQAAWRARLAVWREAWVWVWVAEQEQWLALPVAWEWVAEQEQWQALPAVWVWVAEQERWLVLAVAWVCVAEQEQWQVPEVRQVARWVVVLSAALPGELPAGQ